MDWEGFLLCETTQRKTNTIDTTYMWSLKTNKLLTITKKKQTHRYREQTNGYQWEEGRGRGQNRGRGVRGTNYYV